MAHFYLFNKKTENYFLEVCPDGSVSMTKNEKAKAVLSHEELANVFYHFGLRIVAHCGPENWDVVEIAVKYYKLRHTGSRNWATDKNDGSGLVTVKRKKDAHAFTQMEKDQVLAGFPAGTFEEVSVTQPVGENTIVTPGGSTNPPSSGLPDKPSITNEQKRP